MTELSADLVCFGGGGTGLAAAITAAEHGASVIVLESRHVCGGNSRMGTGLFAAESVVQERLNIRAPRDELFRVAMDYSHWTLDPLIVRRWIDRSAEIVSWLESLGLVFGAVPSLPYGRFPPTWHCPVGGGPALIDTLVGAAQRLGVRIELQTRATELICSDGAVSGVRARRADGSEVAVRAGAVIVGAGGYAGNAEMLRAHYPGYSEDWHLLGVPNPGDGVRAGLAAGAAPEGLGQLQFEGPSMPGSLFVNHALREPRALVVNREGRRFVDEGLLHNPFESANALLRQPGAISFTIIDADLRAEVVRRQANLAAGPVYEAQARDASRFDRQIEPGRGRGIVASSLDDVAAHIGADPEVLASTVAEYNRACAQGFDPVLASEREFLVPCATPPYIVLDGRPGFLETIGGLRIDDQMRVIGAGGAPIGGLYAGGADTGGWEGATYCFMTAGKTLSFALVSGRIAAEHAVSGSRA